MNVDYCTRLSELTLVEEDNSIYEKIYNIDNKNKVKIFRNKSLYDIKKILSNFSQFIKDTLKEKYNENIMLYKTVNDNKIDADLYTRLLNGHKVNIEIKFGNKTDKNIGMKKCSEILKMPIINELLSTEIRDVWKAEFKQTKSLDKHKVKLKNYLNENIDKINQIIYNDNKLKNFDINLLSFSGSMNDGSDYYVFLLKDVNKFELVEKIKTTNNTWTIDPIKKLNTDKDRLNIFIRNKEEKLFIRLCLNWKNNYKIDDMTIPAKMGFGSPSWNIWIKNES